MTDKNIYLDKKSALNLIGDDIEIYETLLETFIDTYENDKMEIKGLSLLLNYNANEILENEDIKNKIIKTAHKIKGGAYTIGANILGNSAMEIEKFLTDSAKGNSLENTDKLNSILNTFNSSYRETIILIKKELS